MAPLNNPLDAARRMQQRLVPLPTPAPAPGPAPIPAPAPGPGPGGVRPLPIGGTIPPRAGGSDTGGTMPPPGGVTAPPNPTVGGTLQQYIGSHRGAATNDAYRNYLTARWHRANRRELTPEMQNSLKTFKIGGNYKDFMSRHNGSDREMWKGMWRRNNGMDITNQQRSLLAARRRATPPKPKGNGVPKAPGVASRTQPGIVPAPKGPAW